MNILSHSNVNLFSQSSEGGMISIAAGQSKIVPDDVTAHPGFEILVRAGLVVKLADPPKEATHGDKGEKETGTQPNPQRAAELNAQALADGKAEEDKPKKNAMQVADEAAKAHAEDMKAYNEMNEQQRAEYDLRVQQGLDTANPNEIARRQSLAHQRNTQRPFEANPSMPNQPQADASKANDDKFKDGVSHNQAAENKAKEGTSASAAADAGEKQRADLDAKNKSDAENKAKAEKANADKAKAEGKKD